MIPTPTTSSRGVAALRSDTAASRALRVAGPAILVVVAAVIIGGTPLSGGYGTVIGAVVGMMIIQVISSGLIFFGIDATWSTFVTGAVIVVAVVLDQIVKWQRNRALARASDG